MIWIQSFEKLMGFEQQCDKQYTFSFLKTNNKSLNQNYHNFNDFLECKVGYNYFSPTVSKMKLKDKETINYTHQIKKLIWVALSNSLKKYTMLSHLRDKNEKMSIFCKKWAFEGTIINFHNLHNSNVIIQSLLAFSYIMSKSFLNFWQNSLKFYFSSSLQRSYAQDLKRKILGECT